VHQLASAADLELGVDAHVALADHGLGLVPVLHSVDEFEQLAKTDAVLAEQDVLGSLVCGHGEELSGPR